ncbi:MAG: glycosyltransferase family 4 protein, partial [Lentisphaerae bacterium]|nr:glycosyltransferase family 4 protein [Lentisphaerota bacterium]
KAAERRRSPVRFHGYLSAEELEACMLASDVGIVPMRDASGVAVPNKVVDYAAHGLAMVCGLSGESLELLKEYQGGVGYEPDNMESFMAALRRYIGNAELLTSHRAGVRRMAEELFDERLIYPEMAAVLADMGGRGLYV